MVSTLPPSLLRSLATRDIFNHIDFAQVEARIDCAGLVIVATFTGLHRLHFRYPEQGGLTINRRFNNQRRNCCICSEAEALRGERDEQS